WVLDFAFKPLRIRPVEIPGKGRRSVHYLYYKVVNRTGKPRMFVPQFTMVNIPPSTKEGVDDAVFGAAAWDNWDPKSDRFSIYVRGLSDGYKEVPNPA